TTRIRSRCSAQRRSVSTSTFSRCPRASCELSDKTMEPRELRARLIDARARTLALVRYLADAQLIGPRLSTWNPLLWPSGHRSSVQELWNLRHARGEPTVRPDGDRLWDSSNIPHDSRWDLPLPSREETLAFMGAPLDRLLERLQKEPS